MSGSKLSELALVNYNNIDDQDFVYVVDGNTSSAGYTSNKMTLEQLRRFIISGATAGVVAQVVIHTLEGSGTSPALPSGMTYATLYNELINEKKPVYLKYLNDFYEVSHVDTDVIKYTSIDTDDVKTISITSASVVSFSVLAIDEIETSAITGATTYTNEVAATKQNNLVIDESTAGLVFGGTTSTLAVNKASVSEVLTDIVDGSTVAASNEIVTADNLKGALSIGQAVDVSCAPQCQGVTYEYSVDGGTTWIGINDFKKSSDFLKTTGFKIRRTNATISENSFFGFHNSLSAPFPKYADGLKYLLIFDFKNEGSTLGNSFMGTNVANGLQSIVGCTYWLSSVQSSENYSRIACTFTAKTIYVFWNPSVSGGTIQLDIKNWRQYEVTNLTDEAIAYLAQLPNPDAYFRSNSVFSLRDKYLVKQDMVCPWTYTIPMGDNSDLTVGAGLSYKIKYTVDRPNNPYKVTVDTIPTDAYGLDAHIQMFVKGTASVQFNDPLILMNPLTANAGNNLSVKFRNGQALVYVDDTNAGYIVVSPTGSTEGTLNYFLNYTPTDKTEDKYIIFALATDNITCDFGTVTPVYAENSNTINLLGNGTDKTTISGTLTIPASKTVNMQDLAVSGSTLSGAGNITMTNTTLVNNTVFDSTIANFGGYNLVIPEGSTVTYNRHYLTVKPLILNGTLYSTTNYLTIQSGSTIEGAGIITGENSDNYSRVDIVNCNITGITFTKDCFIVGNSNSVFNNAYFNMKSKYSGMPYILSGGNFTLNNCKIKVTGGNAILLQTDSLQINSLEINSVIASRASMYFSGTIKLKNPDYSINPNISCQSGYSGKLIFASDCIVDASEATKWSTNILSSTYGKLTIGDNLSLITISGTTANIDAISNIKYISKNGLFEAKNNTSFEITNSEADPWKATNVIFASPLDAHEASTIKLSGTTFTDASKTLNTNRIQLPASTTVSFQGNTNPADTKILDASLIVVGDNPESPSGSATVVNASGTSSTVTGIGTYIDKEGDNDFRPTTSNYNVNNLGTTGAGSLLGALTSASAAATTSNKTEFVRFALTQNKGSASAAADTAVKNTMILTSDYKPVFGGDYTVLSGGLMESFGSNTTTEITGAAIELSSAVIPAEAKLIVSGGVSTVDGTVIKGCGTLDLAGTPRLTKAGGNSMYISGTTITGGSYTNGGAVYATGNGEITLIDCTITGNQATSRGGAVYTIVANSLMISGCSIYGNSGSGTLVNGNFLDRGTATYKDSYVDYTALDSGARLFLVGSNRVDGIDAIGSTPDRGGSITLSSGALLDLTGVATNTPITPLAGITFEPGGATVYPSAGSASAYVLGGMTIPQLGNTNVVNLNGGRVTGLTSASYASNCIFSGGTGALVLGNSAVRLTLDNCTVTKNAVAGTSAGIWIDPGASATLNSCIVSGNSGNYDIFGYGASAAVVASGCTIGHITLNTGASATLAGNNNIKIISAYGAASGSVTISSGASINLTSSIAPGGGITVLTGGCKVNNVDIPAGTYTSIVSSGGSAIAS